MKVEIKETLSRIIDVDTDDKQKAIDTVAKAYQTQQIVLDSNDFIDVRIDVYHEEEHNEIFNNSDG